MRGAGHFAPGDFKHLNWLWGSFSNKRALSVGIILITHKKKLYLKAISSFKRATVDNVFPES